MSEAWTIRRVVAWSSDDFSARGIGSARLDAELLVARALQMDRVRLYMDLDRPLVPDELARVRELVARRRKREPIAYILGEREFWGRRFEVGPAVLVPRPDTETLVERALELLPADAQGPVLDLCTGSGCIGVTLAAERSALLVDLTDLSPEALTLARKNADDLEVGARVTCHQGDLFAALPERREYPLIVCNPPYIDEAERADLMRDVVDFEPSMALFAEHAGFAIIERLVRDAGGWLCPGGTLLIEVGATQAERTESLLREAGFEGLKRHADLGGRERVVEGARRT